MRTYVISLYIYNIILLYNKKINRVISTRNDLSLYFHIYIVKKYKNIKNDHNINNIKIY